MINHKYKFIFVHIPKCGGHSVDKFFLDRGLVDIPKWHATSESLINDHGVNFWNKYYSFSIVRNPWNRMVSEYFWQKENGTSDTKISWGNSTIDFKSFLKMAVKSPTNHRAFKHSDSFNTWYPELEIRCGHLNDQSSFIFDKNNRLLVNEFIKLENIKHDFPKILQKIGLPPHDLPHKNQSKRKKYTEYYDQESINLVADRYHRDIKNFNYKFDE